MILDRKLIPEIVEQVNHYLRGERHEQLANSSIAGVQLARMPQADQDSTEN